MLGGNDKNIKDLLSQVIKNNKKLDKGVNTVALEDAWKIQMGDVISNYTSRIYFNKGRLIVYLTSAPLRSELSMSKPKIIAMLNEECGDEVVKELILK